MGKYKKKPPVLQNQRYGRWLVLESQPAKTSRAKVACRCDCGKLAEVRVSHLQDGFTKSCGCLNRDQHSERAVTPVEALAALDAKRIDGTSILRIQRNGKANRNSKSGVLGVSQIQKSGRWRAVINLRGRHIAVGTYKTMEEAAKARKEAEEKYYKPIIEEWERRQRE